MLIHVTSYKQQVDSMVSVCVCVCLSGVCVQCVVCL